MKSFIEHFEIEYGFNIEYFANPQILDVYIQAGMDKTGSTSVQVFLEENRKALEKEGFYFSADW